MRSLNSLMIQGEAKHWEPEESFMAGGTPRFLGDSTFTLAWQLALGWARIDWNRSMQYPTVEKAQYSEVLTQRYGFVEEANGARAMTPARLVAQLRELARASPTLLLRALDNPNRLLKVSRFDLLLETCTLILAEGHDDLGYRFALRKLAQGVQENRCSLQLEELLALAFRSAVRGRHARA